MTVVVNNASSTFVRALREMAKLDGASVIPDEYGYYSKKTVRSVLKADKQNTEEPFRIFKKRKTELFFWENAYWTEEKIRSLVFEQP